MVMNSNLNKFEIISDFGVFHEVGVDDWLLFCVGWIDFDDFFFMAKIDSGSVLVVGRNGEITRDTTLQTHVNFYFELVLQLRKRRHNRCVRKTNFWSNHKTTSRNNEWRGLKIFLVQKLRWWLWNDVVTWLQLSSQYAWFACVWKSTWGTKNIFNALKHFLKCWPWQAMLFWLQISNCN